MEIIRNHELIPSSGSTLKRKHPNKEQSKLEITRIILSNYFRKFEDN